MMNNSIKKAKHILCFGDSNTWGYMPIKKQRFSPQKRFTGLLQSYFGHGINIIEEGLNGRTTIHNEAHRPLRSAADVLPMLLETHAPLDIIVIMLGTNDLKAKFKSSAMTIAQNVKRLCYMALDCPFNPNLEVILVSPTHITKCDAFGTDTAKNDQDIKDYLEYKGAINTSVQLAGFYKNVAKDLNIHYLDAAKIVKTTSQDGVHWNQQQHHDFAEVLAQKIKEIMTKTNKN